MDVNMEEASNFTERRNFKSFELEAALVNTGDASGTLQYGEASRREESDDLDVQFTELPKEKWMESDDLNNAYERCRIEKELQNTSSYSDVYRDTSNTNSNIYLLIKQEKEKLEKSESKTRDDGKSCSYGDIPTSDTQTELSIQLKSDDVPSEEWARRIYHLHKDKELANILIEAERERRREEGECDDGFSESYNCGRQKYAFINGRVLEITDELYDTIQDIQKRKKTKEDTASKAKEELKKIYKFFRPSENATVLMEKQISENRYHFTDSTQAGKSFSCFIGALRGFVRSCREAFSCCRKQNEE